ncbi:hypothetical protein EBS_1235 [endosymbiont of unidentified scaly snail isolate Monju]|nr:hypothetical protein EBS_1235 [endosymbiont of unidentified scaly snail isolate Monju]
MLRGLEPYHRAFLRIVGSFMAVTQDKRRGACWPWLVLGLMGLVAAGLIATRPQTEPLAIKERAWRVAVVAAEPQTLAPHLTLYGRLESLWSTQLSAPVAAEVLEVAVTEGETVRRDQVLVRLDERDSRLRLQQREAEVRDARARIEAARDQVRLELERCTVRAPFDGCVARLSTAPGRRTRIGDPLLTVYDTGAMVVRALIPERYLPRVRAAMAAGAPPEVRGELDGIGLNGRLRGLSGEVTAGSGGVSGLFDIQGDIGVLRQGRLLRLDMTLPAEPDVVVLPHEAVYGVDKVYIVDRESRMRPVRVERLGEVRGDDGAARACWCARRHCGPACVSWSLICPTRSTGCWCVSRKGRARELPASRGHHRHLRPSPGGGQPADGDDAARRGLGPGQSERPVLSQLRGRGRHRAHPVERGQRRGRGTLVDPAAGAGPA